MVALHAIVAFLVPAVWSGLSRLLTLKMEILVLSAILWQWSVL